MSAYDTAVLVNSPWDYWKLDEAASPSADSGSVGSSGADSGVVTHHAAAGFAGSQYAVSMAGGGYIDVGVLGTVGSLLGAGFSVEFWIKTGSTAANMAIVGEINTGTAVALFVALNTGNNFAVVTAGSTSLFVRDNAGNGYTATITAPIYDNAWHHVVFAVTPATPTAAVYVDGLAVAMTPNGATPLSGGFAAFGWAVTLGARNNRGTPDWKLTGSLDSVAIYPTVLDAATVARHYGASGVPLTARSNWPILITEAAFNADPNSATTPTWSSISSRLLGFSSKRGRTYELAVADVGSATVQLSNTDGAFDPSNTSSPYYPNVKIYRGMRVRANYLGTTYSVLTGYVERWPQSWADGFGTDAAQLVDGMVVLGARELLSMYRELILQASPAGYWPLDEDDPATVAADFTGISGALNRRDSKYGAGLTFQFGQTSSITEDNKCLTLYSSGLANSSASVLRASGPLILANAAFTVEGWFRHNGFAGITRGVIAAQTDGSGFVLFWAYIDGTAGQVVVQIFDRTNTISTATPLGYADNHWHHLAVVFHADATATTDIYVDGANVRTATTGGAVNLSAANLPFEIGGEAYMGAQGYGMQGALAHVAFYSSMLSAAQILAHYTAGANGYFGDGPGKRIGRILDAVPWRLSATTTDVDTSQFVAATDWSGGAALALIQDVAQDAGGVFYVDGSGAARWQSRWTRMLTTASSYTFGDAVGELPYDDAQFDYDPTYVYNDVEIDRKYGTTSVAFNTASQASYFGRKYAADSHLTPQSAADDVANWLVNNYAQPRLRPSVIEIDPGSNAALWPAALGLEIGARVTVRKRPIGSTNTISIPCFIEGVEHAVTPDSWKTRFTVSPVQLQALIWDDPVAGIWDTDVWGY